MLSKIIALIRSEPAQVASSVQAVIALAVALGLSLTPGQTGALEAATTAVLALVPAILARKVSTSLLTGFATAVVTLLVAFGVKGISPGLVSAVNAVITVIAGMVLRGQVTTLVTMRKQQAAAGKLMTANQQGMTLHPDELRAILAEAGDWIYALLISFGWQPKQQQEPPAGM